MTKIGEWRRGTGILAMVFFVELNLAIAFSSSLAIDELLQKKVIVLQDSSFPLSLTHFFFEMNLPFPRPIYTSVSKEIRVKIIQM